MGGARKQAQCSGFVNSNTQPPTFPSPHLLLAFLMSRLLVAGIKIVGCSLGDYQFGKS